jgi:hypothetical protein
MAKTITLKFPAQCRDCGAGLSPGERARFYGRGIVYGLTCHDQTTTNTDTDELGIRWDSKRSVAVTRSGRCEDAPCCGCCTVGE